MKTTAIIIKTFELTNLESFEKTVIGEDVQCGNCGKKHRLTGGPDGWSAVVCLSCKSEMHRDESADGES